MLLMGSVFGYYVLYNGIFVNKLYLKIFPVHGDMRMQLQHPTKKCNPLEKDCLSNFRDFDDLPYCKQSKKHKDVQQKNCEYLDEYEMPAQAFPSSQALIPTRTSTLHQKKMCSSTEKDCKQ